MNGFSRSFLNEDWNALPDAPRVYLSGFGKHPGWNDHLDDIGLVTNSLIEGRRIIYGGIQYQIENATWDRAGADKVAPGFDHIFHWSRPNETITGLIWSSRDGKGRSLYPMIAVAHCVSEPFDWVAEPVLPTLDSVAEECRGTTSAISVVSAFGQAQRNLRARVRKEPPLVSPIGIKPWATHFARTPLALRRILHHVHGNLAPFAPGSQEWCEGEKQARSCRLRLPQIPRAKPAESLNAWVTFFGTQIDASVPILAVLPMDRNWIDVIVGEPSPADFFILRALPTSEPMVSDIPYQLDAALQEGWSGLLADVSAGRLPGVSCLNGTPAETNRVAAAKWLARFRPSGRTGFLGRFLRPGSSPPFEG